MDKSEYWNIYKNEEKHFYYIGTHLEIISMVENIYHTGKKMANVNIISLMLVAAPDF